MYKVSINITELVVRTETPKETAFWIRNEISDYKNIAKDAEEWCKTAKIGDVYSSDFVVITKEGDATNEGSK